MKNLKRINWNKIERFLGSLKLAVILILLFAVAMVIGTFLESYYGTDFANRTVYKTFFLCPFNLACLSPLYLQLF